MKQPMLQPSSDLEAQKDRSAILSNSKPGAEKRVIIPIRGEPRTYLANERTFLKWLRVSIVLSLIGVAILQTLQGTAALAGASFVIGGLLIGIRALYLYYFRSYQIRTLGDGSFYDAKTPLIVIILFVCGVITLSFSKGQVFGVFL